MKINPYLSFNGDCAKAFQFYEKALGGKIVFSMTYGQSPMAAQTPADQHDRVMHISFMVGDQSIGGGDAPPHYATKAQGFCVSLDVKTVEEAESLFQALSENAKIQMPIQETFWAQRFGMLIDQFGTPWMVNCSKPM